jgi:Uma2 family endonuclease
MSDDRQETSVTALPDWMVSHPDGLTTADYDALPEDICRRIEIVDGAIIVSPSPRRSHQIVARRLANALEATVDSNLAVTTDVDLRLRDVPLLNRRPDIVVYDASVPGDEVLRPQHCVLVVEVMSPGSVTTDRVDKPAEYAMVGIEHYWRVEETDRSLTVFRYRLDPTTHVYASAGVDTGTMTVTDPVKLTVDLADLR